MSRTSKKLLLLVAVSMVLFLCGTVESKATMVTLPNQYPTRTGVILVTKDRYKNLIPTGHAAIVYSPKYVIESCKNGVTMGKNKWHKTKKTVWGVTVKETSDKQDRLAAEWCRRKIGKKYNFNYANIKTRKRFYCSQLVWASYKDNFNIDLNTKKYGQAIHPMELVYTDKTKTIYRK